MLKIYHNICCSIDVHKKILVATIATTDEHKVTTYQTKQFSTFTNIFRNNSPITLNLNLLTIQERRNLLGIEYLE